MADFNIMTQWGEQLDVNSIHAQYPRPQFVRDSYVNLNGIWQYAITQDETTPSAYQGDIVVPFSPECPLSGVNRILQPKEFLHYYKKLVLSDAFNRGRVFLHFGAVDQVAKVYINDILVAHHRGGYVPFQIDISHALLAGENELKVVVRDVSDTSYFARGKQRFKRGGIWYSAQSGIWQTVWMESAPINCIANAKITPDYDNGTVSIAFTHHGVAQCVTATVLDGDDVVATGEGTALVTLSIPNFKSWSPEHPFLYDLKFTTSFESIDSYFGMRKFSIGSDKQGVPRLMLNNQPYFHNGVLDQGYYPDGYLTPPSDEAMVFDIQSMKDMGFNMIRKHIKLEPLRWYYHCDKIGMLVWQDMVNGGEQYGLSVNVIPFVNITLNDTKYRNFGRRNEAGRKLFMEETKTTVETLYNVPSIAMWVPFNEAWGQFDSKMVHAFVKNLDATRTIDHASGWHDQGAGDVISKHIYFTPIKVKQYQLPYVLSEFGGLGLKIEGHTFNKKMFGYKNYKSIDELNNAVAKLYENTIVPQIVKGLSATVYTQVTDVEDELNGIFTYDRKVCKLDMQRMAQINKKVKI